MPAPSGSTKQVSVYGRKANLRVVNRHNTFASLEADENDPFGFFPSQPKPKSTYGRSRVSVLPSHFLDDSPAKDAAAKDDSLDVASALDQSAQYDTANSSVSFHAAESTCASSPPAKLSDAAKQSSSTARSVLTTTTLNTKQQKKAPRMTSTSKAKKGAAASSIEVDAVITTPKRRSAPAKRVAVDSPATLRNLEQATIAPTQSTPPSTTSNVRAPRRAAQAARMAIEDYDFTDRDMTPRRPVPTKSYFAEKFRQLAELGLPESQVASGLGVKPKSRKSMAARPRHTTFSRTTLPLATVSSATSAPSASAASTRQSSFTLIIPTIDESLETAPIKPPPAKAKRKQNRHITRRIADSSDDEAETGTAGSDDEDEADVAANLAAQVAGLSVSDQQRTSNGDGHLSALLATVSQTEPESFAKMIQHLRSNRSTKGRRRLEKIGEASYSEVFKIFPAARSAATGNEEAAEALVIKIIPIADPTSEVEMGDEELPYTSAAADVEREIRLMQLIASGAKAAGSFVSLKTAYVVRGSYPAPLLQAWDRWDAKRRTKTGEGAENIRPDALASTHAYAVLVMTDGGVDLESLRVKSWHQAASIFWQVAAGLSAMEASFEFEHRDLHWGNILVQSVSTGESAAGTNASNWLLDSHISGVKATIIDFTLSRAVVAGTRPRARQADVLFSSFDDETLFEGSGDAQFDVYREMRLATHGQWHTHCPATNMLWLRYLAHKLIDVKCKACKIPTVQPASNDDAAVREWEAHKSLLSAAERLDRAAQHVLGDDAAPREKTTRRKSLHPRATTAAVGTAARGPRKGRATTRVVPLTKDIHSATENVRSAAQLMELLTL